MYLFFLLKILFFFAQVSNCTFYSRARLPFYIFIVLLFWYNHLKVRFEVPFLVYTSIVWGIYDLKYSFDAYIRGNVWNSGIRLREGVFFGQYSGKVERNCFFFCQQRNWVIYVFGQCEEFYWLGIGKFVLVHIFGRTMIHIHLKNISIH